MIENIEYAEQTFANEESSVINKIPINTYLMFYFTDEFENIHIKLHNCYFFLIRITCNYICHQSRSNPRNCIVTMAWSYMFHLYDFVFVKKKENNVVYNVLGYIQS